MLISVFLLVSALALTSRAADKCGAGDNGCADTYGEVSEQTQIK